MKRTILLVLTFIIYGCEKPAEPVTLQSTADSPPDFQINKESVAVISEGFWKSKTADSKNARAAATRARSQLQELKSKDGKTVFFVENYKNGSGFAVISADKRLTPILAYADKGSFDVNTDNPGVKLWMELIQENFSIAQKNDTISTEIETLWQMYSESEIQKKLKAAFTGIYPNCGDIPPQYVPVEISNLTANKSTWGQRTGYNFYCPTRNNSHCSCEKALAGCGPVAVGQVLRYHEKPITVSGHSYSTTDFQNMPPSLSSSACDLTNPNHQNVARILRGLGNDLLVDYHLATECQTALTVPDNIRSFFNMNGFSCTKLNFFDNIGTINNEIQNFRPVVLYGKSCDICIWNAHIWVLDGYRRSYYWTWEHYLGNPQHPLMLCKLAFKDEYQMNWGWSGSENNGWFTYNNIVGNGTHYNNAHMAAYIVLP